MAQNDLGTGGKNSPSDPLMEALVNIELSGSLALDIIGFLGALLTVQYSPASYEIAGRRERLVRLMCVQASPRNCAGTSPFWRAKSQGCASRAKRSLVSASIQARAFWRTRGCHRSVYTTIGSPSTVGSTQNAHCGSSRQSGKFLPLST